MTRAIIFACILALFAGQVFGSVDDAYTKSLLHFNSDLTDESGKTWYPVGAATASTTESKFGGGALALNGTNSAAKASDSADFAPGAASFTIDCWIYPRTFGTFNIIAEQIVGDFDRWLLYLNSGSLAFWSSNGVSLSAGSACSIDAWNHVAITRDGASWRMFLNGTIVGSATSTSELQNPAADIYIGKQNWSGFEYHFHGYVDEFRFSNGIARWTSNFLVPSSEYAPYSEPPVNNHTGVGFAQGGRLGLDSTLVVKEYLVALFHHDLLEATIDDIGKTWTGYNYASSWIGSPAYKLGNAAVQVGENTGSFSTFLRADQDDDLVPGDRDFCFDFWMMPASARDDEIYILYSQYQDSSNYWQVFYQHNGGSGGKFGFKYYSGYSQIAEEWVDPGLPAIPAEFYHFEISRTASQSHYFVNGIEKMKTVAVDMGNKTIETLSSPVYIWNTPIHGSNMVAWYLLDETRLQIGGGGHTSNFTPEAKPYTSRYFVPLDGILTLTR